MLIPLSDRASELGAEIGIIGGSGFYDFQTTMREYTLLVPGGDLRTSSSNELVITVKWDGTSTSAGSTPACVATSSLGHATS